MESIKKFCIDNKGKIDISMEDELAFRYSCEKGNLELAKWLLKIKPNINISACGEYAFRWACAEGYLKIAKWLLKIKPNINISEYCEYAFIFACKNGKLDVIKWLLEIKPDINISINNEAAFAWSCINGHLEIVKLLFTIKDYWNTNFLKLCINQEIIEFIKSYIRTKWFNIIKKKDNNELEITCPICISNINEYVETPCNHKFCNECIIKWIETNNSCPYCRMII